MLTSATVANSARQRIAHELFREPVRWQAYGSYVFKGFDEPLEIREPGFEGVTTFVAPTSGDKAAPLPQQDAVPSRRRGWSIALAAFILLGAVAAYLVRSTSLRPAVPPNASNIRQTVDTLANVSDFGGRPAIAVLPFDNLSPDPEQAFFADGLAQDLITRLSAWRAFPVIARNSSFQYRGGSSTVAASLVGDLTRAEGERARQEGTENLQASSLYQLGLQRAARLTRDDSLEAMELFERALALDPRFAAALARIAMAHWMTFAGDGSAATPEQLSAALATARRALELDPRDPVVHAALASVYLAAGDPTNALDAARQAVELNPSMPEAWIWLGWAQVLAGDPEACIVATKRAQRLDPHGPRVWIYDSLALANWEAGHYARLREGMRSCL